MSAQKSIHHNKRSTELPAEDELIEFNYSAAGHEGISSNASGSLVIKPCTQAEIDFYEAAKKHEFFQAHMPTFMGILTLQQDQSIIPLLGSSATLLAGQALTNIDIQNFGSENTPTLTSTMSRSVKRTSWKPSGGKKLSTGLAIVLENVAAGFKHPNILDAKLGARLWDDDAPRSKRQRLDEVSKDTTSSSLGFRIAGMKIWLGEDGDSSLTHSIRPNFGSPKSELHTQIKNSYKSYDKHYGRTFEAQNIKDAFITYLGGADTDGDHGTLRLKRKRAKLIVKRILRELESIQYVLENEESRMYSASILMVYEGDEEALEVALRKEEQLSKETEEEDAKVHNTSVFAETERSEDREDDTFDDDEDEDEIENKVHDVRLIDFAHAHWAPGSGPDENALHGIRSIIKIFEELVND